MSAVIVCWFLIGMAVLSLLTAISPKTPKFYQALFACVSVAFSCMLVFLLVKGLI
jgi:hypothetical protein